MAVATGGSACRTGERGKLPEDTAGSLEMLAEDSRRNLPAKTEQAQGLPPATTPTRYDPCGIPLAVSIEAMIRPKAIVRIQEELVNRGHLARDSYKEGQLESTTLAAILELQKQADLPPVGLPTYSTVEALGLEPTAIFTTGDPNCEKGA